VFDVGGPIAVTARTLVAMRYLLLVMLYVFVAWTLVTAWIQVSGRRRARTATPKAAASRPQPSNAGSGAPGATMAAEAAAMRAAPVGAGAVGASNLDVGAKRSRGKRTQPAEVHVVTEGGRITVFRLDDEEPLTIGRDGACEIVVEDQHVSGRHARLFPSKGSWMLEDLRSTNGTLLNDRRIAKPNAVAVGDVAILGNTTLEFVG
jgi:hypothetical protein